MIAYCNYIPDAIWVREAVNGVRRITLRKNFIEKDTTNMDGSTEKQYQFDETDVCITDRDNLQDFVNNNFDNLFLSGLQQVANNAASETKIQATQQMVVTGKLVDDLQLLGQQITNIMLGV